MRLCLFACVCLSLCVSVRVCVVRAIVRARAHSVIAGGPASQAEAHGEDEELFHVFLPVFGKATKELADAEGRILRPDDELFEVLMGP